MSCLGEEVADSAILLSSAIILMKPSEDFSAKGLLGGSGDCLDKL